MDKREGGRDGRTIRWTNRQLDGRTDNRLDEQTGCQTYGRTDRKTCRQPDEWRNRRMDNTWTGRQLNKRQIDG
eukprot:351397-Chlamydomonas_euryale.AAC.5